MHGQRPPPVLGPRAAAVLVAPMLRPIVLSSTRLEALGLAAGLSFARGWTGRVEWRLDNKGVISSWRRLRQAAPSAWAKVNDRDVQGYRVPVD